jgi:hypothetical protein
MSQSTMRGFFSLEGAKRGLGVVEVIEETVVRARDEYLENNPSQNLPHLSTDMAALWPKLDHLLYQPVLGVERPRCFYYYQGDGLEALYGFTYKYLTLEHFLGQLARIQVGRRLAETLSRVYVQAWYPGDEALTLFVDWHTKPHWTKFSSHSGHIAMWGRTMPGTKQLILNGSDGRYLGGWNYPIDGHMTHTLVDLEANLEEVLGRPISCTIMDSEGGGIPLGERYAEAKRHYISVLPREHSYRLADFVVTGGWEAVNDDPQREAALADWADPKRAAADPRQFVLMRPVGQREPTRIYTGQFGQLLAGQIPEGHRGRWLCNELRIRNLIQGANLNVNYGYTYTEVAHRTRQREWETAQERVAVTQRQLADHQSAVHNLRQRLADLNQTDAAQYRDLQLQLVQQQLEVRRRHRLGLTTTRPQQRVVRLRQQLVALAQRFGKRQRQLYQQLRHHQTRSGLLNERLRQRLALREAIDTDTLCRERHLDKDQVMLTWQLLLANLHDWVAQSFLAPTWRNLTLEKATQMIYRKAGRVTWYDDRIEVILEPYRYADQQRAMEVTCARFNAANLRWRDGRLLRISVASPAKL